METLKYKTLEILYERILEILNYRMDIGNLIRMDIGNRMEGYAFVSGKGPPQRHVLRDTIIGLVKRCENISDERVWRLSIT